MTSSAPFRGNNTMYPSDLKTPIGDISKYNRLSPRVGTDVEGNLNISQYASHDKSALLSLTYCLWY